jgi:hypothetical protein
MTFGVRGHLGLPIGGHGFLVAASTQSDGSPAVAAAFSDLVPALEGTSGQRWRRALPV